MTLTQLYEEVDQKRLSYSVRVGGHLVTSAVFVAAEWSFSFGQVPTCSIRIRGATPAWVTFGASVEVDVGYNGLLASVFTGTVETPSADADGRTIECRGKSRLLEVPYKRLVVTLTSIAASTAVTNLLASAGVLDRVVSLPAWTIGTVKAQTLEFQTYGEAVVKIAEVDGSPWYEMPSGQVRVDVRDPLPAPAVFRQYFSGRLSGVTYAQPAGVTNANARPRIVRCSHTTTPREVRNRVTVRGAVIDSVESDGSTTSDEIETACDGPSPWVPVGFQEFSFSNELIDTVAKAAAVCSRYYGLLNRLESRVPLAVEGDPELFLGATVEVIDPDYSGVSGKWFVWSYRGAIDSGGFSTDMELRGGGPAAGTTPLMDPFACFHWRNSTQTQPGGDDTPGTGGAKYQQVVPPGTDGGPPAGGEAVIVTLDASCSSDPDGSIASYAWSDDAGHAGTGRVVTWVYDPALVSSANVTLTVTDNDGRTDAVTKQVSVKSDATDPDTGDPIGEAVDDSALGGGPIQIPTIFCAAGNNMMASPDGGVTWNDRTTAAAGATGSFISVSVRVDADYATVGIFGTTTGELHRTTDDCVTSTLVYTVPGGPRIEAIWADVVDGGIWWASTVDGRLYRSPDEGVSWSLYHDFADGFPLYAIATPGDGSLFVFGGDSGTPDSLVRRDGAKTGVWQSMAVGGDLQAALLAAGAGHNVVAAASRELDDLAVLFDTGLTPRHFYTTDVFGDGSGWTQAVGLAALGGVSLAPGYLGAGDLLAVVASTTTYSASDGINFVAGANPSPSQINHLFWESGQANVYIGAAAAGIVKTVDHGETWGYIRPLGALTWPAGAVGYQISFVAAPQEPPEADLYIAARDNAVPAESLYARMTTGFGWTEKDPGNEPPGNDKTLIYCGEGLLVLGGRDAAADFRRSQDYGELWTTIALPSATGPRLAFDRTNRRLWAVTSISPSTNNIYYSDNDGTTWTLADTFASAGSFSFTISVRADNPNYIVATWATGPAGARVRVSTDGGVTWATQTVTGMGFAPNAGALWIPFQGTANGRIIYVGDDGDIAVSDDAGATWTVKHLGSFTAPGLSALAMIRQGGMSGPVFAVAGSTAIPAFLLMRSLDLGDNWEEIGALPAATEPKGLVYDLLTDSLYMVFQGSSSCYKLATAGSRTGWTTIAAGDWENLGEVDPALEISPFEMDILTLMDDV